jgi:aminoglycoside phosphotransferase (APT) family kinase protein
MTSQSATSQSATSQTATSQTATRRTTTGQTANSTAIPEAELHERIVKYLSEQLSGATDLRLEGIERIAVGWSHETWLFDAHWHEAGTPRQLGLCLRRDPGGTLLRHLSDLDVQFQVLRCLEPTPVPTPKAYWFESDQNVLGAPFLVMEKVPGVCPNPWGRDGRRFYEEAAARGVLPLSFTDTLAALHTLDWEEAGLSFLGVPGDGNDFARREVAKWRELISVCEQPADPVMTDLLCWLDSNAPPTERLVLVHGAYRTGNFLVEDDRVSALLDWELQVIGDPMYDVAYVLSELNREGSELLSYVVDRDTFYSRYEAATGIEIDDEVCRYYQLLYAMRSAAFWMSASGLYASGRSSDLRLARTAWSVPTVLERAARDLGY